MTWVWLTCFATILAVDPDSYGRFAEHARDDVLRLLKRQ